MTHATRNQLISKLTEIKNLKTKIIKIESDISRETDKSDRQNIYMKSKDKEISKLKQEIDRINSNPCIPISENITQVQSENDSMRKQIHLLNEQLQKSKGISEKEEYITSRVNEELSRLVNLIENAVIENSSNEITSTVMNRLKSMEDIKVMLSKKHHVQLLELTLKIICDFLISHDDSSLSRGKRNLPIKTTLSDLKDDFSDKEAEHAPYPTAPVSEQPSPMFRSQSKSVTARKLPPRKSNHSTPNKYGSKAVFNPFTKKRSDYFDPYLQHGGQTMYYNNQAFQRSKKYRCALKAKVLHWQYNRASEKSY